MGHATVAQPDQTVPTAGASGMARLCQELLGWAWSGPANFPHRL
jgi:hypothetical protein